MYLFNSDKECDIRLKITSVSRQQAIIATTCENGHIVLKNISKTNPTFVNDTAVKESIQLKDGDIIMIADRKFVFQSNESKL